MPFISTEIKPPADCRAAQMYYVSKADAPLAASTPLAYLNIEDRDYSMNDRLKCKDRLIYKDSRDIFKEVEAGGVCFLEIPLIGDTQIVRHGFSTRHGGVSVGMYSSMNLGFGRGDSRQAVQENFSRMAKALGVTTESIVFSRQTHTTNVRTVGQQDRGKGLEKETDYRDVDGLITNVPEACLATFYADCVPLYFVDPVKKAIGLSHSGWRGTVGKIGKITIERMTEEYGTNPEDVIGAIGPSICQECYEVSEDVIKQFQNVFAATQWDRLFYQKANGKYQLNLWCANQLILEEAGMRRENIAVTNLCTCCNDSILFSHRASGGKRGNLGAFLGIV